ncbi:methyltransferase domain-containing protein [Rubinisphaera margarita]|uniref:methyltransferase domain-containing protein n=1 Tax=Rubinisphaera margarita TaxID=2909586 RepID=UPI001EE91D9E|nr:methyltransferase domain-containing protein [Rubinisphaera margarita]MCG6158180.1 methyltransferase domain-containing protein [Rubinisphaera margarita]
MIGRALRHRQREPELMDQPGLDARLHAQALNGLARVNTISRTAPMLWNRIRKLPRKAAEPLRVLDVACGGGDTALSLARLASRSGANVEVSGCDFSSTAIAHASQAAESAGVRVRFFEQDVLAQPLPDDYDVIYSTLFLHHLSEEDAVRLLTNMRQAARQMVLVSDLKRTWRSYAMTYVGIRLLTRSRICHVDGPLSVRAAFTPEEARDLALQAGLKDHSLQLCWPERFLLTWRTS